jgi:predicted alpha/beta superfamily hydrolase
MLRRLLIGSCFAAAAACASSASEPVGGTPPPAPTQHGGDAAAPPGPSPSPTTPQPGPTAQPDGGAPPPAPADAAAPAEAASGATVIRVHYPAGSHTLSLRGSVAPYNWNTGVAMQGGAGNTWTITTSAVTQPMEWKPLLDDATWSRGPNYKISPGQTVDVYPHFTQVQGTWSRAYDFPSQVLGNTRGIWIYLPPTYVENTLASMPVVYMHDGQNLFDPSAAFGGNTWQVQQTMDAAAEDGTIAEAIVVGVENTSDRINEYTPVPDPQNGGGKGDVYLKMLTTELKPHVDATMRTLPDRANTLMIGSSLGGLITAYAGVTSSDVFGRVGVMSPSTWWDNNWLIGEVSTTMPAPARPLLVYIDSGDSGTSNDDVTQTAMLHAQYQSLGYSDGSTLKYVVQAGGQHSEIYWAQRLPGALAFLLGAGR